MVCMMEYLTVTCKEYTCYGIYPESQETKWASSLSFAEVINKLAQIGFDVVPGIVIPYQGGGTIIMRRDRPAAGGSA